MKEKIRKSSGAQLLTAIKEALIAKRKSVFLSLLTFASAYAFSGAEVIFETFPFGLSLMCAVRKNVAFAVSGALLGCARGGEEGFMYAAGCIIGAAFRYAIAYTLDRRSMGINTLSDGIAPRLAASGASAFTVALTRIIYGGFEYYDLIAGVFLMMAAVGSTYVFTLGLDEEKRSSKGREAGVAGLMFASVLALEYIRPFGISLGGAAAFFFTLAAARRGGALRGVMIGFITGAAIDVELCPILGVTGFVCGVLSGAVSWLAMPAAVVIGLFTGIYSGSLTLLMKYLPEASISLSAALLLEYFKVMPRLSADEADNAAKVLKAESFILEKGKLAAEKRLLELASAAEAEGRMLSALAKRERTLSSDEIADLCGAVLMQECSGCASRRICYPETGKPSRTRLLSLGTRMYGGKALTAEALTDKSGGCCFAERITGRINVRYAALAESRLKCDRVGCSARGIELMSEWVSREIADIKAEYKINAELTKRLIIDGAYGKLIGDNVAVYGRREMKIVAVGKKGAELAQKAGEIKKDFERLLSVKLTEPEREIREGQTALRMQRAKKYSVSSAKRSTVKDGEIVNGDSVMEARYEGGFSFYAVCDGMGSGKDAALSSKLAASSLKNLITAGADVPLALKMLNYIIGLRASECFSTLDMLAFNAYDGMATFYKCGASPSLVLRDGRVFRLASHTPPVGALTEPEAERIEFELKDGDTVILMSDGVARANGDIVWLSELLSDGLDDKSPDSVCERIVAEAEKRFGCEDDMTVLAVRITNACGTGAFL